MKTAIEEWVRELARRPTTLGNLSEPAVYDVLRQALAERDAALAEAREGERLARSVLGDHQEEYRPQWQQMREVCLEEVRGRVLAWLDIRRTLAKDRLSEFRGDHTRSALFAAEYHAFADAALFLESLGPARDPLPPTQAERELEALREGVRGVMRWAEERKESRRKGMMEGFLTAHVEFDAMASAAQRLRELLGEGNTSG